MNNAYFSAKGISLGGGGLVFDCFPFLAVFFLADVFALTVIEVSMCNVFDTSTGCGVAMVV